MPIACIKNVKTYISALLVILWFSGCSSTREGRPLPDYSVGEVPDKQSGTVLKGAPARLVSQEPFEFKALSLPQAHSLAQVHNPLIRATQSSKNLARAERIQAGLWKNPQLEVFSEEVPINSGGLSQANNMLGIAQTIPFPGKKKMDREIADIGVKQSNFYYESVAIQVRQNVEIAYYQVLGAEKRQSIAEELLNVAKSLSETANKRFNAGASAAQEGVRAEIEYEMALAKVLDIKREVAAARRALMNVIGKQQVEWLPLTDKMLIKTDPVILTNAKASILDKHPRLRAALAAKEGSDVAVKRAKRERYPDVTFGIAGGREEIEGQELVEFRISLPLPIIDRGQAKISKAFAESEIAAARLTAVEQALLGEFNQLKIGHHAAMQKVMAYRERILPKSDEALRMVQMGFEEGKFEFIDLLDTQRMAAEARLDYQKSLLDLNEIQARLKALIGK